MAFDTMTASNNLTFCWRGSGDLPHDAAAQTYVTTYLTVHFSATEFFNTHNREKEIEDAIVFVVSIFFRDKNKQIKGH